MLEGIFISKSEKIHENSIISVAELLPGPYHPMYGTFTHIDPHKNQPFI